MTTTQQHGEAEQRDYARRRLAGIHRTPAQRAVDGSACAQRQRSPSQQIALA